MKADIITFSYTFTKKMESMFTSRTGIGMTQTIKWKLNTLKYINSGDRVTDIQKGREETDI